MVMLKEVSRRPAGFILVTDIDTGKRIFEGEVRQCIHCQYTWRHVPGSGVRRGWCMRCNGFTCGRARCDTCYHKEKQIEDMEAVGRRNRAAINALVRQQALRERIHQFLR